MGIEERLQVLEEEHQLVRGELKQTLVNVRDFLLELNLPALQEEEQCERHEHHETHDGENVPQNKGPVDEPQPYQTPVEPSPPMPSPAPPAPQPMAPAMPGSISMMNKIGSDAAPPPVSTFNKDDFVYENEEYSEPLDETQVIDDASDEEQVTPFDQSEPSSSMQHPEEPQWPTEETSAYDDEIDDEEIQAQESPLQEKREDPPAEKEPSCEPAARLQGYEPNRKTIAERTSQINLLTNLIRWVTIAKKEIGLDYLPAFLDVYGIGDVISDEMRQTILYLTETLSPRPTQEPFVPSGRKAEHALEAEAGASEETKINTEFQPLTVAQPVVEPNGEVWNRMILELHGILRCSEIAFEEKQLPWKRNTTPMEESPAAEIPADISSVTEESESNILESPIPLEEPQDDEAFLDEEVDDTEPEQPQEIQPKPKNKARKSKKKTASLEPVGARLKLVLPVGDDQETEIDIGEFNLNLNRNNNWD